jgi:putative DNA primase/helicase
VNRAGLKRLLTPDGKAINSNADHHMQYGDYVHPVDAQDTRLEYFVLVEVFRDEICKGYNHKEVARLLIELGLLMPDSDGGPTRKERLPGFGPCRVYRFRPEILSYFI